MNDQTILKNISLTYRLLQKGNTPDVIGIVSGSASAKIFWKKVLNRSQSFFKEKKTLSFHEDLPVNQAFGLLLLWQRLKKHITSSVEKKQSRKNACDALVAFVFGDGVRSTPFTETDNAQKPAIMTFAQTSTGKRTRYMSMVELAMGFFIPVQQYLKRSGFKGLVVKWGDEIQIPSSDLSGKDTCLKNADVVRFVSMRTMNEDEAMNKDWMGIDAQGHITRFIPRRPLADMEKLADTGLLHRRNGQLYGGVNLGSVAVSYDLLEALLKEFKKEVNDPAADRSMRPCLDPEFFTALTIAVIKDKEERQNAWQKAIQESPDVQKLSTCFPDITARLEKVVRQFEQAHKRKPKIMAMDFQKPYWGDIGQHKKIHDFYMALNAPGAKGDIARALANIPSQRDKNNNILAGQTHISPQVKVQNSVLVNARISGTGLVKDSVLIGTHAHNVQVRHGFDVLSTAKDLVIGPGGGAYQVVSSRPVQVAQEERITTLFLPDNGPQIFRVKENTDLKDKNKNYAVPIMGNPLSFQEAHIKMGKISIEDLTSKRQQARQQTIDLIAMSKKR